MPKQVLTDHRYDFRGGRNTAISPDLLTPNELVDCTNARLSQQYGGFTKRSGTQRIHQTPFAGGVSCVTQWDGPSGKQVVVIAGGSLYWRDGFSYTAAFQKAVSNSTVRTTANQGTSAGWTDPVDNGDSSILGTSSDGITSVAAGNCLVNKLGDPAINGNLPAADQLYTLTFRVNANTAGNLSHNVTCETDVTLEYSVNSGGSYTALPGTYSAVAGYRQSTTIVYNPTVSIPAAGSPIWIRVRVTQNAVNTGTDGICNSNVYVYATAWLTDNYPVTWHTGSAAFSSTQPTLFAPFRAATAGAPLVLYMASGGHYFSWDGVGTLTQLDAPPNSNNVPAATSIISYHTRMFAMTAAPGFPGSFPKTIFWSKIGDATNYATGDKTFGGSAVTDFLTGQQLTALEVIGSSLLMSTADSIMRFTGHASDDIVISQDTEGVSAEIGAIGPTALKRFENVACAMTDRGPYAVTEVYAQPMGEQLNPDWIALDTAHLTTSIVEYNRNRKEVWIAAPGINDGGIPKTIFSQSVRLQAWQGPWTYPFQMNCLAKYYDVNNVPNVISGGQDGYVRLMDVGTLDDVNFDGSGGSAITMQVELPVMHFGMPGIKKALKWMILQGQLPIGSNLTVNVAFDGGLFAAFPVIPNDNGEEDYRVDLAGDGSQGFRPRIQFVDASVQPVTIEGCTLVAWDMQRTT
jgi:hypothetical protein